MNWCKRMCNPSDVGQGFLVTKPDQSSRFYRKVSDIEKPLLQDRYVSIIKLQKSDFDELNRKAQKQNKKFSDPTFVPSHHIIGKLNDKVNTDMWKRLSDLKEKFTIFNKQTSPFEATNYKYGVKVFHAALAAIAEDQKKLDKIFDKQQFNQKNGLYKILLKNKSKIQEIIIDDYVPFLAQGKYALSKPLINQVWVLLLQKALAKVYKSYSQMYVQLSTPNDIFQCLLYSSAQKIQVNNTESQSQLIWNKLQENYSPICFSTSSKGDPGKALYLTPNHYYTFLGAQQLININGVSQKIIKIRDAFKNEKLVGDLTFTDDKFWQSITNEDAKNKLLKTDNDKNGIFFMRYNTFLQIAQTIYFSQYHPTYSYITEQVGLNIKNGHLFQIQSFKQVVYNFTIEQYDLSTLDVSQFYVEDGFCRATLLLIYIDPKEINNKYKLLTSLLQYNRKKIELSYKLPTGKYLIYIKLQPTIHKKNFPKIINFSVYSQFLLKIQAKKQQDHRDFLKKVFLNDAKQNKRQFYEQDKMWASWNIVRGGYGYIVLSNQKQNNSKFVVKLNQEQINAKNYKLKKPFKGKKITQFQVLPGSQEIILLRVKNSDVKQISFPIPLQLSIESISIPSK